MESYSTPLYVIVESRFMQQSGSWQAAGRQCKVNCLASRPPAIYILTSISSLGRYVFGSEISYNKAPPRLPGLGC